MLYRSIRVLAVCAAFVLVCHNAIAQQDEGKTLLAEGDRLAWLKNWQAAEPFFEKAEALFQKRGDHRNELYAQISRIRGELPRRGLLRNIDLS